MSDQITVIATKGSEENLLSVELDGFRTNDGAISIHEAIVNDKFVQDMEVLPFNLGFEYPIADIANHFLVDQGYDTGEVIEGGVAPNTVKLSQKQTAGVGVAITSAENNPTSNSPFNISVVFSEAITNGSFVAGDLAITNGSAGAPSSGDDVTFTVAITPTGDGEVTVKVPHSVITSNVGSKVNVASEVFSVEYEA